MSTTCQPQPTDFDEFDPFDEAGLRNRYAELTTEIQKENPTATDDEVHSIALGRLDTDEQDRMIAVYMRTVYRKLRKGQQLSLDDQEALEIWERAAT